MEHSHTDTIPAGSVTTMVRRRVRQGQEAGYEAWLTDLLREAGALPGYLGTDVRRPKAPDRIYVSIFRFDTLANLEGFERSDMRRAHLARVTPFVEADAVWDRMSGLEVWFDAPAGTIAPQPTRWKMALLLIGLVFVLVEILSAIVGFLAPGLPSRLSLLTVVTAQVCLLTYVIMPPVTRRLAFWLFPSPPQPKD
jgi:uncharacterized protein